MTESPRAPHRRAAPSRVAADDLRASRRPVLVAVGPAGGASALRVARTMAEREARPLIVLSVVEPPPLHTLDPERVMLVPWTIDEQLQTRRQAIHDLVRDGAPTPFGDDEAEIVVLFGDATETITSEARRRRAHVIVMGSGPHALEHRLFATETTLATIRRAVCPVVAVAKDAVSPPRTVVVAMDFGPASLHAARQALPHLSDGAVVHLVHVWQRHAPLLPTSAPSDLDEAYLRALPGRFERARTILGRERSVVVVTTVREGVVSDTLLDVSAEVRADLVVAGARGLGLMERLLVGSTSTALLRGASCSVLIAPEPPPTERARLLRHMTGTSTMRAPAEWAAELDAFAQRNRHRRTALEIDDESLGAQVQETGYALLGATYDHRDRHVALMFGDPEHPDAHLTRSLADVRSVAVARGVGDEDGALRIESDQGSTLLTFLDQPGHPTP